MAKTDKARQLASLITDLQDERQQHADAIAEIDSTLEGFGIEVGKAPARRGRRPGRKKVSKNQGAKKVGKKKGTKKKQRRIKKTYTQTADEFVLGLVKNKPLTTKQVNDAWSAAGRSGAANNTLTKLTKEKKLKRRNLKGSRGSEYTAA